MVACKKINKPRKVFDEKKARVKVHDFDLIQQGTDLEKFTKVAIEKPIKPQQKKDWRAKHLSFISMVRGADQTRRN